MLCLGSLVAEATRGCCEHPVREQPQLSVIKAEEAEEWWEMKDVWKDTSRVPGHFYLFLEP